MKVKILPALLICLVVVMMHGTAGAQTTSQPSDAQKAFDNMKNWQVRGKRRS